MKYLVVFMAMLASCAHATNPVKSPPATVLTPNLVPPRFYLIGEITDDVVPFALEFLAAHPDPEIVLSTPGGYRSAATAIADAIIKHGNVTCVVHDRAASGGFAILQACRVRVMNKNSVLGTHEVRIIVPTAVERVFAGILLETLTKASKEWNTRCRARLKLTEEEYEARVKGKDWSMDASEALAVGAVDRVLQ